MRSKLFIAVLQETPKEIENKIRQYMETTLSELINICEKSPYTFAELQSLVIDWAKEKGIIGENQNPQNQYLKVMSEFGELCDSLIKFEKDGYPNLIDSVGDTIVTLIILAEQKRELQSTYISKHNVRNGTFYQLCTRFIQNAINYDTRSMSEITQSIAWLYNVNPTDCLYSAYRVISSRKGVLVNGTFIKDTEKECTNDCENCVSK